MKEGRQIDNYLRLSGETGMYSIGADFVADVVEHRFLPGGAKYLKHQTLELLQSDHPDDKAAVTRINRTFTQNDYAESRKLNNFLETPVQQNVVEWMSGAIEHDIEEFCRWNLLRTWHLTKALHRDRPKLIQETLEKTQLLVDIGVFPRPALPLMEASTGRYYLQGIDAFHAGGHNLSAFCGAEVIGMSNMYLSRRRMYYRTHSLKRTTFHEDLHGVGRDRGFFWGISQPISGVMRALEEPFVEHATTVAYPLLRALPLRQPHVIDPHKRINGSGDGSSYIPLRTFMAHTMEHSGIEWDELSEAYFSPRGDERGEFLRSDIERKIGKFFGTFESFLEFNDEYEQCNQSERDPLLKRTITSLTQVAA